MSVTSTQPPPLNWWTKLGYASGGIVPQVAQRGLVGFLLIFYNQVVGLPAHMVASVLLVTTLCDAVLDPTVGQVSDHLSSRWGRRHPFIYASVLPLVIAFALLWSPPLGWSPAMLVGYLLVMLLIVRLADSLFELPSAALLPELTKNYDERTVIVSVRLFMGLAAGMLMQILALRVFLKENVHGGGGVLARDGYFAFGLSSALVMGAAILLSGIATHKRIPYLSPPPKLTPSIPAMLREVGATLNNRSYLGLLAVGILMSTATGAKTSLDLYFQLYFWQLTQAQVSALIVATLIGTVAGVSAAPVVTRRFGKRQAAVYLIIAGVVCNVGPVLGRLAGVMPANGTPLLFPILLIDAVATFCIASMTVISITSMLNDVVEDVEVKTGRRSEGLLMAADTFFRKLVGGVGIFVAGVMITLISFPRHAARGSVPPEVVAKLAYAYIPITFFLLASVFMLYFYRISRESHEENLRILQARRQREVVGPATPHDEALQALDRRPAGEVV